MTERTRDARARQLRERIVRVAGELLDQGGREAVSARSVSAAVGIQPAVLYRQFGDMRQLLDAVAREAFLAYMRQYAGHARPADPVDAVRRGWDLHVAFGLAHPAAYALVYGDTTPAAGAPTARPAAMEAEAGLHRLLTRVAEAGRLRVDVPTAVRLLTAAGSGVTLALIAIPPGARDPHLSALLRDTVLAAITVASDVDGGEDPAGGTATQQLTACAVTLRALLAAAPTNATGQLLDAFSPGERYLLGEWLDRLAAPGTSRKAASGG